MVKSCGRNVAPGPITASDAMSAAATVSGCGGSSGAAHSAVRRIASSMASSITADSTSFRTTSEADPPSANRLANTRSVSHS